MPLTLTLRNTDRLDNGSPTSLVLDQRGAIIGRAATVDWCLPDPTRELSSRHCEIQFRDGAYVLNDISTNGTFLQGSSGRLPTPRTIAAGDVFLIGQFEIVAALDDATAAAMAARNASPPPPAWKGWGPADGADAPSPAPATSGWDAAAPSAAISGAGPMSGNWAAPSTANSTAPAGGGWGAAPAAAPAAAPGWGAPAAAAPSPSGAGWGAPPPPAEPASGGGWGAPPAPAEPASGGWGASAPPPAASFAAPTQASTWETPAPPPPPASDWSTPAAPPPPPSAADVWGQVAASNVVDWARGGFGAPAPTPAFDPAPAPAFAPVPAASAPVAPVTPLPERTAMPAPISAPAAMPAPPAPVAAAASAPGGIEHLLAATGLGPSALKQDPAAALRQAGDVLRRLVAGFVVMLEARARAKSQLGAAGTSLEFDGNNPLKFARTPEQALAQLLNPAERGFMPADRAIEDAFRDLQAHQVATLKAMQGALRATLDRFSPTAIRSRADQKGLIAKIMPGARDATLWQTYEREFGGVAQGSDEAFMDVFAKEFRKAYDETVRGG